MNATLIAVGPPPLTVEAADCSIDVIDFMAAAVRGVDLIEVTPSVREAWRSYLATYYSLLNPIDRYWFATAPSTLAAIRTGWPQLQEMQRDAYLQAWASALPAMLQFIDPVLHGAAPMQSYLPPSGMQNADPMQSAYRTGQINTTDLHQGPVSSISSLVSQIQSRQQKAEEEASQGGGAELAQQVKLQNEAANMQMLSNMSQMRYQSMMAVAKNMKY